MKLLYRLGLGLSVVGLLLPVVASAVPGQSGFPLSGSRDPGHDPQAFARALGSAEVVQDLPARVETPRAYSTATEGPQATVEEGWLIEDPTMTVNRSESEGSHTAHDDEGGAATTDTTIAAKSNPTTKATIPAGTGAVITGDACPCTVKGTTELQGTVNLKGDLMVAGGTLIARPGVTVNGNGFQIMFMQGGRADFQGSEVFTWSGNGSNANLTRDINFINLRRIMFHGAGKSNLRYFTVRDSGTPALGDYPIHFHLNGNSVRGTLVEGVVVLNGRRHAFVPHGSHGITFIHNIAKNTAGPAFWWDDPGTNNCDNQWRVGCTTDNSNDITVNRLLVDGVWNTPGDPSGFRLSGVSLGAGRDNSLRNSLVKNIHPKSIKDCSAFHWPEGATQPDGIGIWEFQNNFGSSDCHGIFTWQNDGQLHVVDGYSGGGISHGAYESNFTYKNIQVPYLHIHAVNWRVETSSVGDIRIMDHVFSGTVDLTDVQIKSISVEDNAKDGHVVFSADQTNADCGVVKWVRPHPETQVILNGVTCEKP